jgi:sugar O-acyltransferase (sialic acid O-acetyltransferase NeuD family)
MKKELILIGGGGHCHSCIDVIEIENNYSIKGIIDLPANLGKEVLGYKVLGTDDDLAKYSSDKSISFLITIGQIKNPEARIRVFEKLVSLRANIATIISPLSHVAQTAKLGRGVIVMHQALVNANAVIKDNVIINTKSLIEHDVLVSEHCHIATAAVINGNVIVGRGVFVGSNSVIKQGAIVPEKTLVQAGTFYK